MIIIQMDKIVIQIILIVIQVKRGNYNKGKYDNTGKCS